jgi:hypothetical protein
MLELQVQKIKIERAKKSTLVYRRKLTLIEQKFKAIKNKTKKPQV